MSHEVERASNGRECPQDYHDNNNINNENNNHIDRLWNVQIRVSYDLYLIYFYVPACILPSYSKQPLGAVTRYGSCFGRWFSFVSGFCFAGCFMAGKSERNHEKRFRNHSKEFRVQNRSMLHCRRIRQEHVHLEQSRRRSRWDKVHDITGHESIADIKNV